MQQPPKTRFFCSEATQTADSRTFFVRKPRRRPIQEPPKTSFVQKPHRQPIQGPFVGWKPRRQPIQEPPNPRTCFLFGSHADSRFKDFFCSEATQTADPRAIENKVFLFRSHTDSAPNIPQSSASNSTGTMMITTACTPGMGAARFKDPLLVGSHADSRVKSHQTRGLVFCLEATQTADSRTFFVRKPRRRPIQEPPKTRFFCSEATQTADSRTSCWLEATQTDSRATKPEDLFFVWKPRRQPIQGLFLFGSHADSRSKSHRKATQTADSRTFFCSEATQTADSRATEPEDLFFVWKPRRQPIQGLFLFGSHADSRSKSHRKQGFFCSEATQTADSRTFCWLEAAQIADSRATKPEDLFFVWEPRRQPIQGLFLFGSHADGRSKSHRKQGFVQKPHRQPIQGPFVGWKPRRQPIQEPPNPRTCFLFGSHADSRFKDFFCSEAMQTADPTATEKPHRQPDSRTFCWLEATQTDSRATKPEDLFFVWKPRRQRIQGPFLFGSHADSRSKSHRKQVFLFRSHTDSRFKDLVLVGSRADSRFKSHRTRGLVFCLEATQTADSRTFFVRKPRRQPIQEPPKTRFFVQKPHRQPTQGPFVGWKPRRQPIQEPPNPRTCFLFGSHNARTRALWRAHWKISRLHEDGDCCGDGSVFCWLSFVQ